MPHDFAPLRIVLVCYGDFSNASSKQAGAFAQGLVELGHAVFMSMYGDPKSVARERILSQPGLTIRFRREFGPWLSRREVQAVQDFRPDLLHVFSPRHVIVSVARQYHAGTGVPVVVHWEDDEIGIKQGVVARTPIRRMARLGRRLLRYPWPRQGGIFVTNASLQWIRRTAIACDALTPGLTEEVTRGLDMHCTTIFPATLRRTDAQEASDRLLQLPSYAREALKVAYTGSVHTESIDDFRLALRAVAALHSQGRDVVFVHAGSALPRFSLPDIAEAEGLAPNRAFFLGDLPFHEVPGLLQQVTVLVQPGRPNRFNSLRLPSKVQAYLESGTPTVMFSVGLGELLIDREEVVKLTGFDSDELAERIAELLDSPDLARLVGLGGRRAAERLFDRRRNVEALVACYRNALTQASRATR